MKKDRKEPLYRKHKKTGVKCRSALYLNVGGDYRWKRNSKEMKEWEGTFQGMGGKVQRGYDYTPLYRFLQSKVGKPWDEVHSEAVSRLDKPDAIFYIVYPEYDENTRPVVNLAENSSWHALTIDEGGILVYIDREAEAFPPGCMCCSHSLNGNPVPMPKSWDEQRNWVQAYLERNNEQA